MPSSFQVDRTFVESGAVAWFFSFLELWIVEGLGDLDMVEGAVLRSQIGAHDFTYGADADTSEASTRLRHRFEWWIIRHTGRVVTWADFEVARVSRKHGSLVGFSAARTLLETGITVDETKFPLVPPFLRHANIPAGLAIPPLLSLRLYAHFIGRLQRKLPTMPPGDELSAKVEVMRRWEHLVSLEFCCAVLNTAIIERRQHARVPVLPPDLLAFITTTMHIDMLNTPFPGPHYGTPRDTLNELMQATSVANGLLELVTVPLSSEPVAYVSLDILFDENFERRAVQAILPIEEGAAIPPKMKKRMEEEAREKAAEAEEVVKSVVGEQAVGNTLLEDRTPLPAASSVHQDTAVENKTDGEPDKGDSSPVVSLSPVGTWKSGDLSPAPIVEVLDEIQPLAGPGARLPDSSKFQAGRKPMQSSDPPHTAVAMLPCVHSCPKSAYNPHVSSSDPDHHPKPLHSPPIVDMSSVHKQLTPPAVVSVAGGAASSAPVLSASILPGKPVSASSPPKKENRQDQSPIATEIVVSGGSPDADKSAQRTEDTTTEVVGELVAGNASQAGPSSSTAGQCKEETAVVERVSRSGGVDQVDGQAVIIPLHMVTNVRVCVGDVLRDYPDWSVPLTGYLDTPWKVVALRDVCQRVAGWVRDQDPSTERRGPRGGGGWRTKATMAMNANGTLREANQELTRRLDHARRDADNAHNEVRRLRDERSRMHGDIVDLRRNLDDARASGGRTQVLKDELESLRGEHDRLRSRLDESERENHTLLRDLVARRRRRSPSSSRSPSPKRRRRSDGGRRSGFGW